MTFSKILVAIDIDEPDHAFAALEASRTLNVAQNRAGKIEIIYVRHHLPTSYDELLTTDFDVQEIEAARQRVAEWTARFELDGATFSSRRGRVRDEVLDEAAQIGADLIIIGSHQPSLSSRVLGSNAVAIVRNSPISVLIARQKE